MFVVVFTLVKIGQHSSTFGNPPTKQPHSFFNIHSCPNRTKVDGPEMAQIKSNRVLLTV